MLNWLNWLHDRNKGASHSVFHTELHHNLSTIKLNYEDGNMAEQIKNHYHFILPWAQTI